MKKVLLFAVSLMALFACNEETVENKVDEIAVSVPEYVFDAAGQKAGVAVRSSGDWTLGTKDNAECEWLKPSVSEGKDGETVVFEVVSVPKTNQKSVFAFKSGNASAEFSAFFNASEEDCLTLESAAERKVGYVAHKEAININTNVYYRDIRVETEDGKNWLSHAMNTQDDDINKAKVVLELMENDTAQERSAQVTIKAGTATPVTVTVIQMPQSVIEVGSPSYTVGETGSVLEMPVSANVEYTVTVSEAWLEHTGNSDGKELFSYGSSEIYRSAEVTLAEKSPASGVEAVTVVIPVIQKVKMIGCVADMKKARAFVENWADAAPLKNMTSFTVEALVRFQPDDYTRNKVGTIFGIKDKFSLKRGKNIWDRNRLELAYAKADGTVVSLGQEDKDAMRLPENKWTHLAVTVGNGTITVFIDGRKAASVSDAGIAPVDFTKPFDPTPTVLNPGNFFISYEAPEEDVFAGLMSEFRIWNKALSETQINEGMHFYMVDPASEGLVAYWKFNDGESAVIKDHTANGNHLKGQKNIAKAGVLTPRVECEDGMNWVEVSLPE